MANLREFYVPAGAGSNFLAGQCLWTDKFETGTRKKTSSDNEFFFERMKINVDWKDIPRSFQYDNIDLVKATAKVLPILVELDSIINALAPNVKNTDNYPLRHNIINNIHSPLVELWKVGQLNYHCSAFVKEIQPDWYSYGFNDGYTEEETEIIPGIIPVSVVEKITQAQDFFAQCREYYFAICEQHNWKSHIITHQHPYDTISPRIKLPKNFKSLAMELDVDANIFIYALQQIKGNQIDIEAIESLKLFPDRFDGSNNDTCIKFADDIVSYRKIFFENDSDDIRKMYEFFGNEEYFDENKTNILLEFQKYHNSNVELIQKVFVDKLGIEI